MVWRETHKRMTISETGTKQFLGGLDRRYENTGTRQFVGSLAADGKSMRVGEYETPTVMFDNEWLMVWCGCEEERARLMRRTEWRQ